MPARLAGRQPYRTERGPTVVRPLVNGRRRSIPIGTLERVRTVGATGLDRDDPDRRLQRSPVHVRQSGSPQRGTTRPCSSGRRRRRRPAIPARTIAGGAGRRSVHRPGDGGWRGRHDPGRRLGRRGRAAARRPSAGRGGSWERPRWVVRAPEPSVAGSLSTRTRRPSATRVRRIGGDPRPSRWPPVRPTYVLVDDGRRRAARARRRQPVLPRPVRSRLVDRRDPGARRHARPPDRHAGRARSTTRRRPSTSDQGGAGPDPPRLRLGRAGVFGVAPRTPYYGAVDTAALFVMALGEALRWGAVRRDAIADVEPAARAALEWCDRIRRRRRRRIHRVGAPRLGPHQPGLEGQRRQHRRPRRLDHRRHVSRWPRCRRTGTGRCERWSKSSSTWASATGPTNRAAADALAARFADAFVFPSADGRVRRPRARPGQAAARRAGIQRRPRALERDPRPRRRCGGRRAARRADLVLRSGGCAP